jgi:hypothetical protein
VGALEVGEEKKETLYFFEDITPLTTILGRVAGTFCLHLVEHLPSIRKGTTSPLTLNQRASRSFQITG